MNTKRVRFNLNTVYHICDRIDTSSYLDAELSRLAIDVVDRIRQSLQSIEEEVLEYEEEQARIHSNGPGTKTPG
jgi:hypothetical protein